MYVVKTMLKTHRYVAWLKSTHRHSSSILSHAQTHRDMDSFNEGKLIDKMTRFDKIL